MSSTTEEKIAFLSRFKSDIEAKFNGTGDPDVRTRINRGMRRARELVAETGAMKTVTLSPPPAIGGLVVHNADPFSFILESYYGMSMIPTVCDMIEEAIGVLEDPEYEHRRLATTQASQGTGKRKILRSGNSHHHEPELPANVTLAWLVRNVPISFWVWLAGIIAAAIALGIRIGTLLP